MIIRKLYIIGCFILLAAIATIFACRHESAGEPAAYRLVVVIVIDQMRPDYFTRFGHQFSGGLARVQNSGAVFLNGFHEHSMTATAVGHATIATGLLPRHHGVVGNSWYDRSERRKVYSSEDSTVTIIDHPDAEGQSPRRLLRPALGDWLKEKSPSSKVVSVALKDRSATFMGGLRADAAFWIDTKSGDLVTSTYYMNNCPYFVDSFNNSGFIRQFNGHRWDRMLPDTAYHNLEPETSIAAHDARQITFPHSIADSAIRPDEKYYEELFSSPFGDLITIELAERITREYQLGQDAQPDILMLGCSSADLIGHSFGPNSDEVQDYYLRLDQYLADFFVFLDSLCGPNNYLTVLSSDHGVMPFPEYLFSQGIQSHRLNSDTLKQKILTLGEKVAKNHEVTGNFLYYEGGDLVIDYDKLPANGILPVELENELAQEIRGLPDVADVYTRTELSENKQTRPFMNLYVNNYYPSRGGDLIVRIKENVLNIAGPKGTTHLTPYKYDTQVPIVFLGHGIISEMHADSIRTIDIAPTIFDLLGYRESDKFDGRSVRDIISKPIR